MDCCDIESSDEAIEAQRYRQLMYKFFAAAVFGFGLLLLSLAHLLPNIQPGISQGFWVGTAIVVLGIMVYAGGHFYQGAWTALKDRRTNMDTLVAIGTGAAWLYSFFMIVFPGFFPSLARHAYFDTALIIIALINLGAALETKARGKTSEAIKHLIGLTPKTARVVTEAGEQDILLSDVKVGDMIRVRPGEKIPVDGLIIEGHSHVDESMLTGEPVAIKKTAGAEITGGTMNKEGTFLYQATRVGEATVLAQIISMVKQAQQSKPAIARLADKISAVFVPCVLICAVLTAVIWFEFGPEPVLAHIVITTMAVLLIACPCALGLATPISVMVGIGKAAEQGILIRNGEALQKAGKLHTVVLDKTGTITAGRPSVTDIWIQESWQEAQVLAYAASLEQGSEHPLATAIIESANKKSIALSTAKDFVAVSGYGVKGIIDNKQLLLGNVKFMQQQGIDVESTIYNNFAQQAKTPVCLAIGGQLAGIIAIADPLKEDSKQAITALQKLDLRVVMLTGDHAQTAQAIANEVGIASTDVIAEVLPHDKDKVISQLQAQGAVTAMVGDGINDAPALARADVGFAIGTGTDIAIESADITLMRGSLLGIVNAIYISKLTMRNIKQNLFGAFAYNTLGIPIAAGVLYPFLGILLNPIIAAAAMAASSLTVVLNALRLRLLKVKR